MANDFYVLKAEKLKSGGVHYRGVFTVVTDVVIDDDDDGGGGGGGGGRRKPPYKIEIPDLTMKIKWIYGDGTPAWAIAGAQAAGHDTVHVNDLPPNYPFAD